MWVNHVIAVIHIIAMISVVFIEHKKPMEALLWVVVISLLPVVGLALYACLGSTFRIKVHHFARGKKLDTTLLETLPIEPADPVAFALLDVAQAEMATFNESYNDSILSLHNSAEIITSGREKYARLFSDIKNAKQSVNLVYYGLHYDRIGKELVAILTEKAKEGVRVRVLFDGMGSLFTPRRMFLQFVAAGGYVKKIRPSFTHFRNHRKIVVIDGLVGYTGGMNIGIKYVGALKNKSPWRDTQIRMEGDAVHFLQYYFYYDWFCANSKPNISTAEIEQAFPAHGVTDELPCQVVGGGVDTDAEMIKLAYIRLVNSAKKRIVLQTPYFIPDDSLLNALKIALASGVEVILMLPGRKSSFFLEPVSNYYIDALLPYGLRVYKYDGYIHAKTVTVDDCATCIGTANVDVRSLELDDEICVLFYDRVFTKEHIKVIEEDLRNSAPLDTAKFLKRSLLKKAKERFFKLFAPLM
ncbi:cardiolipin synthase [Christensenellaceae bacterium OttesenSCG-928-M15]|nr:cardiolipin synthase [Christensenellaceae bacterium OttesenSCG-928-M15]